MYNIGTTKYVINDHDGIQKHKDGSDFFGIYLFRNKKLFQKKIKELLKEGYLQTN